jgi:hypothetical protein
MDLSLRMDNLSQRLYSPVRHFDHTNMRSPLFFKPAHLRAHTGKRIKDGCLAGVGKPYQTNPHLNLTSNLPF